MFPKAALSTRANRNSVTLTVFLGVFAVFGVVVGGLFTYFTTIRPVMSIIAARSWVPTPCTIIASAVKEHPSSEGGPTYSIDITYSYLFNGVRHESDRYDFSTASSSALGWRNAVVDALPPGRVTTCYVDPHDPSQAVINRQLHAELLWGLVSLVFFVIGLLLLSGAGWWYSVGRHKRQAVPARLEQSFARNYRTGSDPTASRSNDDGPLTLTPEVSRRAEILVGLFITLFWNGIVGFFAFNADQFTTNGPRWAGVFFWIFLTPLFIAGLSMVAMLGKLVLGLFNPLPVLTLSRPRIPLGGKARVTWFLDGRWDAVESLTIRLQGSEVSDRPKYGAASGRVFHDEIVLERKLPDEVAAGEVEFAIPAHLMHSFKSKYNAIVWQLAVVGRIAWWPPVRGNFPIRVTPHE